MAKEVKEIISLFVKAIIVAFAVAGILFASGKVQILNKDDIHLVAVNGNTGEEYVLFINGEEHLYRGEWETYYAPNSK